MHMSRMYRFLNGIVSLIMFMCLLIAGAYAGYALWDNNQIYMAAENVQADMIHLKPVIETAEGEEAQRPSFDELLAINKDVRAWISMDGTMIDYPVLQGETNFSYINTDVYGNFALAGSIFLDSRCTETFEEAYWLFYGHDMANSKMFGDLALYKDEAFYQNNTAGMLMLPGGAYELKTFACLLVRSNDEVIFEPGRWEEDITGVLEYALENAMHCDEETINWLMGIMADPELQTPKIVALTTCSSEFTDARTIVLTYATDYFGPAEQEDEEV